VDARIAATEGERESMTGEDGSAAQKSCMGLSTAFLTTLSGCRRLCRGCLFPMLMLLGCGGAQGQRHVLGELAPCWDPEANRGTGTPVTGPLLDPLAPRQYLQESAIHLETFCQIGSDGQLRSEVQRVECERNRCETMFQRGMGWQRADSSPWTGSAQEVDDCRSTIRQMLISRYADLGAEFSEPVMLRHDGDVSAFRLFALPSRGVARAMVRVVRTGDLVHVISKRIERSETRGQGRLGWTRQRVLGKSEWTRLEQLVAQSRFWELPTLQPPEEEVLRDGTVYYLEGVKSGVQRVVSVRWYDVAFAALVQYLSSLGGCDTN